MYDTHNVIGSDEAGVGDYFGPMTVCACYVDAQKIELLKTLGVKDSKNLSNNTVNKIAKDIIHTIPYALVVLDNKNYNQKIESGWNIVQLKAILHDHCIKTLYDKLNDQEKSNIDFIVIDQFTTLNAYQKYVKSPFMSEKISQETKAESKSLAVACASIIARSKYLEQMNHLNNHLNREVPRGASKKVDEFAAKLAKEKGMNFVDRITKKHFKTRDKVLQLIQ